MNTFDIKYLKKISYPMLYDRGMDYYRNKSVINMKIFKDTSFNRNMIDISAKVLGSGKNTYDPIVTLSNGNLLYHECDCMFHNDNPSIMCKHVIAMLLNYINMSSSDLPTNGLSPEFILNLKKERFP